MNGQAAAVLAPRVAAAAVHQAAECVRLAYLLPRPGLLPDRPIGLPSSHVDPKATRRSRSPLRSDLSPPAADGLARALEAALETEPALAPGTHLGPYKLLQLLGEGGFGSVWMAEQSEPLRRRVALKIIKAGMDTREVIARFEAERQALAMMDHPNIARVFDAGETDTGRPYFVMELVRGVPITRYCDENRLPTEARLALFIDVCHAVQHAHQKGVIHRDLKPSNILVTLHDGEPVPKVIDFGIAKATGATLTDKTLFTQFHAFLGTPTYTSPEQMEMSGLDVDTRSDIYSLGVLLYELLAGRPPFDPDALARSGLDAMRRTIREVEPPRPSQRLRTLPLADRTSVAHQRGTEITRLAMTLRGDLDWIVMRCLEKNRTRRYATASGIASDIERHLRSEPVKARPPSALYHLGRFVRRHRLGVGAGVAIILSLVAGLIASGVLLVRERTALWRAIGAERAESALRQHAETARLAELKRAATTALDGANRHLASDNLPDGLAYLVHAARLDPDNGLLALRLASVLASSQILVPEGEPLQLRAGNLASMFRHDGRLLEVFSESGDIAAIDLATGEIRKNPLPTAVNLWTDVGNEWMQPGILCRDGLVRVLDRESLQVARAIRFDRRPLWVMNIGADAQQLFVAFEDQSTALVDLGTGNVRRIDVRESPGNADSLFFGGPGRRWLVSRVPPDRLEVWDMMAGERRHTGALTDLLHHARVSDDGTLLATLTALEHDPGGLRLQVWSLPELRQLIAPVRVECASTTVPGAYLKISRDGRRILVWSPIGRQIYESATGRRIGPTFTSPASLGLAHAWFSPDGTRLAGLVDGGIQIVETTTGNAVSGRMTHPSPLLAVAFSRDGDLLLTTCRDGTARLWDTNTGKLVGRPLVRDPTGISAVLSPDGTRLVIGTAGGAVHRLRVEHRAVRPIILPRPSTGPMPVQFLPNPPARLMWLEPERARVIDVASGRDVVGGFPFPERIGSLRGDRGPAMRTDLSLMVVCTRDERWQAWYYGPHGVNRVVPLEDAPRGGAWVCISPRGDTAAMIASDDITTIRFWNLDTGKPVGRPCVSGAGFYTTNARIADFSPDGRRFVAGANDGRLSVWDVATGEHALSLGPVREDRFKFVGYSPDGTRIGTTQVNLGDAQLWDAHSGQPVGPVHRFAGGLGTATFSGDGRCFVVCPVARAPVGYDRDGTQVLELDLLEGVRSVRFSSDDRLIATTSNDTTARIWDAVTGLRLSDPMTHFGRVVTSEFSPDGRFLCTEVAGSVAPTSFCLWSVMREKGDTPTPDWLLQLATIYAGKRIDESGRCVDATASLAALESVRRTIGTLPPDAPFVEWGRWILDSSRARPIAPGFTITPDEADQLAAALARGAPSAAP